MEKVYWLKTIKADGFTCHVGKKQCFLFNNCNPYCTYHPFKDKTDKLFGGCVLKGYIIVEAKPHEKGSKKFVGDLKGFKGE